MTIVSSQLSNVEAGLCEDGLLNPGAGGQMKSYLVLMEEFIEDRIFLLQERLSIGRLPSNDICPSDSTISREHAVVYRSDGKAVVEDLGSLNGTFVNGKRVQRAIISSGDALRLGNVAFRFVQEEVEPDSAHLTETQELFESEITVSSEDSGPSSRAQRLTEAIARVPIFSKLEEDDLVEVSRAAHMVIFDRGRTIIQERERSQSLYIMLEGSVRVLTYDGQGEEIELGRLSEGQIFGESAFLDGIPCAATVQALEESLLCQISSEALRRILSRRPGTKEQFELFCRARLADMEARKRDAGIIDERSLSPLKVTLPVSFSVSASKGAASRFEGKAFRSFSEDVSVSGIRIKVRKLALFKLPSGCRLRLEISFPHPWGVMRCSGILRSMERRKEGRDLGYLNVRFLSLSRVLRNQLEEFLRGD